MSSSTFNKSAFGGDGWLPRKQSHAQELGSLWADCGICSEWHTLEKIILHCPGKELDDVNTDPDSALLLSELDQQRAREEHQLMADAYRSHNVEVWTHHDSLTGSTEPTPNLMFCADLFAMTPQGAILARPASIARAGEERIMAATLTQYGVPILKTLTAGATFEGADLMWVNDRLAILGVGLRTNREGADQIVRLLDEIGVATVVVDLPYGTMHFMGMLRIVDRDIAIAWPRRTPFAAVTTLRDNGYRVVFLPDTEEAEHHKAFNFVTLGPGKILMVADNPVTQNFYESLGVECVCTPATELMKAAGAVGCLTGIVKRKCS